MFTFHHAYFGFTCPLSTCDSFFTNFNRTCCKLSHVDKEQISPKRILYMVVYKVI